jgi:Tetratricopeptide repeat/Peptidase_C39 like family
MFFHSSTITGNNLSRARRNVASLLCVLLLPLMGLLSGGCAGHQLSEIRRQVGDLPSRVELKTVPFYPQNAYQCGPAALAMALSWSGLPKEPETLVPMVYSPELKGSLQPALIGATRRSGRVAYPINGMNVLLREVASSHPVIVLLNLGLSWYPKWHYAVVVGYDLSEGFVEVHSGKTAREPFPFRVFENTWARSKYWGLLVLSPRELPATATEKPYLQAVLGLERARQWRGAVQGYETALGRWPGSLGALMGLGNSLYALGQLTRAEKTFREASHLHPTSGAAFNNLAQVLWEQGRQEEALQAVRKAVALGGPQSAVYGETLKEIESRKP